MSREGPDPAVRDRKCLGEGRRAASEGRAGRGVPAVGRLPPAEVRAKNKRWLVSAAVIAALLVTGAADGIWLLLRAWGAEARATAALHDEQIAVHQATEAEQEALKQRDLAQAERQEAETARQSLRRSLYASDIQLAEEAWESGNILRMRALLDGQKPRAGDDDLRGFEWHYLRRLGSAVQMTMLAHGTTLGKLSPDGTHYVGIGKNVAPKGPEVNSEVELRLLDVAPAGRYEGSSRSRARRSAPTYTRCRSALMVSDLFLWPHPRWGGPRELAGRSRSSSGRPVRLFVRLPISMACPAPWPSITRAGGWPWSVPGRGAAGSDLRIWEIDNGKEILAIPLTGRHIVDRDAVRGVQSRRSLACGADEAQSSRCLPFDSDVSPVLVTGRPMDSVGEAEYVTPEGKELFRFATRPGSSGLAYSPDGNRLIEIGGPGKSHWLRDAGSGREILELAIRARRRVDMGMAFSPDGLRLAGSSGDGKLRIWNVTDGEPGGGRAPEQILDGKTNRMTQVAWSTDGRRVSTSVYGGTVLTWQVAARHPHIVVKGSEHINSVTAAVAAASQRFAAVSRTLMVRPWSRSGTTPATSYSRRTDQHRSDAPHKVPEGRAQPRRHSPGLLRQ